MASMLLMQRPAQASITLPYEHYAKHPRWFKSANRRTPLNPLLSDSRLDSGYFLKDSQLLSSEKLRFLAVSDPWFFLRPQGFQSGPSTFRWRSWKSIFLRRYALLLVFFRGSFACFFWFSFWNALRIWVLTQGSRCFCGFWTPNTLILTLVADSPTMSASDMLLHGFSISHCFSGMMPGYLNRFWDVRLTTADTIHLWILHNLETSLGVLGIVLGWQPVHFASAYRSQAPHIETLATSFHASIW